MPLEPGQVVDQYRLDQTIHRGRATIVYAATDLGLGRKVAFKVLGDRYATDEVIRRRFVNEAQVAASLDGHPHIVTVYKWGEFEGSMYFVTELIDGISLAELLERQPGGRPLQPNEALELLAQIADALDFAHKRGAIHRDVKPANVMVKMTDTPRSAYLVDFGITKMDDGETGPQGMFLGTPDYASPEQISGLRRSIGARTSIRSPARRSRYSPAVRRSATPRTTRPASRRICRVRSRASDRYARSCHRPSTTSLPRPWPRTVRIATAAVASSCASCATCSRRPGVPDPDVSVGVPDLGGTADPVDADFTGPGFEVDVAGGPVPRRRRHSRIPPSQHPPGRAGCGPCRF